MNQPEKELKQIIEVIKDGRSSGASAEEILLSLRQFMPVEIREIAPDYKTTEEKRKYMKEYRLLKKKYQSIALKQNKREAVRQMKIDKALKRTSFVCYVCNKHLTLNSEENKFKIEKMRGLNKEKIIVLNKCPTCEKELRAFGGYLDVKIS